MQIPEQVQSDFKINGSGFSFDEVEVAFEYATQLAVTKGNRFDLELNGEIYHNVILSDLKDLVREICAQEGL